MSRWDALRSDNDRVDPTPTSLSSRRWRPPGKGSAVQHRDSSHVVQGEERNSYASSRGSVKSRRNSTNNHERRVDGKINNSSQRQQESHLAKKEEQLRDALHQLRNAASSFSTNDTNNKSVDENNLESPFQKSIDMLVHSIFGKIESASFFQGAGVNKHNFAMAESFVSQDVIWEVCHSLLKEIEFLSESNKCIKECIHFIIRISILTSACLQLLLDIHQTKSSSRPKAMSDLRLCDCASILLNILGNESNLFTDQSTIIFTDEVSCKASLFQCLAKVMAVSAINWAGNGERSPLFPWGAENAVDLVMKQSVLPFIEKLTASDDFDLTPLMKMKHCYGAIESVYLLLKDPNDGSLPDIIDGKLTNRQPQLSKHGAAILAPLVIDVLPDGKENQRFNPLRSKTLSAVGNFWNWTCEVIDSADQKFIGKFMESCMSYECLIVTLNSLYALRKAKSKSPQHCEKGLPGNTHELDASNIARQIHNMIQSEALHENRSKFLHVLTSLCLAYPGASASQWHLFLERSGSQLQSKDSSLPILLTLVENGNTSLASGKLGSKDCIILPDVLRAISVLISSMPLTLWIAGEGRVSTRLSGGNIASRVRSAVASVMPCLLNLMTSIRDNLVTMSGVYRHEKSSSPSSVEVVMVQCSLLAGQLCTRIPFSRENSVFLQPCSNLVRCAGDIYVLSAKSIERESPSPRILHKSMSIFSFVITESLGGNVTDIAQATPVSPPAHHWLSTKSSYEFIGMLLSGPLSCRDSPLFNLAKSSPWALTREPFNLASFCDLCVVHCSNENDEESRFLGVKLIESFVLGRRNFLAECISHKMDFSVVTESFCPLLLSALDDKSASVRICAVTSFGSLLQYDWQVLFTPNSNIADDLSSKDYRLIESILRMCSGHHRDKNASIRSSSCKAVGDIYTICIDCVNGESDSFVVDPLPPFTDEFAIILSSKICNVMEHALADKNAPVRSMVSCIFEHSRMSVSTLSSSLYLNSYLYWIGTVCNW